MNRFLFAVAFFLVGHWFGALPLAFAQGSFTGAENYTNGGNNTEADQGLQSATPSDGGEEYGSEYGGNETTSDYGLDGGGEDAFGQPLDTGNQYSEGGTGDNLFGTDENANYDNAPQSTGTTGTGTTGNTGTNTAPTNGNQLMQQIESQPVQTPPSQQSAPIQTAPVNPAAPVNPTQPVNPALAPATDPALGQQYYPTAQDPVPAGPVAPPLPPPNEFSGAPPVPGSMRIMADGEAPEEYIVEPGDTLFDICDQLLDEPAYWPKLWALNPEIKNPHFIYPRMKLRFYPGDEETPPYLQVVAEDDVIPIDKGALDESELIVEPIQFATETFAEPDQVAIIGPEEVEVGLSDLQITGARPFVPAVQLRVPGFIFSEEKEPDGVVLHGRYREVSLAQDGHVVIEQEGELGVGSTYTVIRPARSINSPDSGEFVGYLYYWVGNVKIDRALEDELYVGTVTESRLTLRPDDLVVDFISTARSIPSAYDVGSISTVDSNVVAFTYDAQEIGGQGEFVFFDQGSSGGLSQGMYVPIYATPDFYSQFLGKMDTPLDPIQVGVARIIDSTPVGAVGYIVKSDNVVRIGDKTRKG